MATEETPYLAEKAATWERPVGSDPRDERIPPEPTPKWADQDLVVERADLGPDAAPLWPRATRSRPSWPGFPGGQPRAGPGASGSPCPGGTAGSGPGSRTATP